MLWFRTKIVAVIFMGTSGFLSEMTAQQAPAVDGINGKIAPVGISVDGHGDGGVLGSLTAPLGHNYALQLDGIAADIDLGTFGSAGFYTGSAHLFWRDPKRGLLGIYGSYTDVDLFNGLSSYTAAAEGAWYKKRNTLEGLFGYTGGDFSNRSLFSVAKYAYYPTDDIKLPIGHRYNLNAHFGTAGAEWAFHN